MPSPDPSSTPLPDPTPILTTVAEFSGSALDEVRLLTFAVVVGIALMVVCLSTIAVVVSWRR